MGKDKNKEQDWETATSAESITNPQNSYQTSRDLSQEREARDAALAKTITEAVAREMAKAHAHYCTIPVPVIVLYLCCTLVSSFTTNLNSTELHLQGVAPRSQYSDPMLEAVMLQ